MVCHSCFSFIPLTYPLIPLLHHLQLLSILPPCRYLFSFRPHARIFADTLRVPFMLVLFAMVKIILFLRLSLSLSSLF